MVALMIIPVNAETAVFTDYNSGMYGTINAWYWDNFDGTWSLNEPAYWHSVTNLTSCGLVALGLKIGTGGTASWGRVFVPVNISTIPVNATITNAVLQVSVTSGQLTNFPIVVHYASDYLYSNYSAHLCGLNGLSYPNNLTYPCDNAVLDTQDLSTGSPKNFTVTDAVRRVYNTTGLLTLVLVGDDEINNAGDTYINAENSTDLCSFGSDDGLKLYVTYTLRGGQNQSQLSGMGLYASNVTELGKGVGGFFYGVQFGLLPLVLGLMFVGAIGLFFYAIFNIVTTSVKEGFKK